MPIEKIFSFLTYHKTHARFEDDIEGIAIKPDQGKLSKMLNEVFESGTSRRDVPIVFVAKDKLNETRSELIKFFDSPGMSTARPLARTLQNATPGTAGMGLFFICLGSDEGKAGKRVVLSRFAAEEAVVASRKRGVLSVEFVEQVFLKNAHSYKAAIYRHEAGKSDAWKGIATDRQLNHGAKAIADYWIVTFLRSELTTTAAEGTRRLAIAMKTVSKSSTDPRVRGEIVAAAKLAQNLPANAMTIEQFCDQFALSPSAAAAVKAAVQPSRLIHESFRFDNAEFIKHVPYKQIELDNQVILAAPIDTFDKVVKHKTDGEDHSFSTHGRIVDERLRSNK